MGDYIVATAIGLGCIFLLGVTLAVSLIETMGRGDSDRDQ